MLRQGLGARALEQQRRAARNAEGAAVRDDVLVVQPVQRFTFCDQPVVVGDSACHLQDLLFGALILGDQQHITR